MVVAKLENRLPLLYLVDSAGVFLPLQDEVFPDEDDFGRVFRHNAVLSARGIPQMAGPHRLLLAHCAGHGAFGGRQYQYALPGERRMMMMIDGWLRLEPAGAR